MTDQRNANDVVINEALGVIDGALAKMLSRDFVSTGEIADLLLDVRTLLTTDVQAEANSTPLASMPVINTIEPVAAESV